jgi:hypothetical protein
VAIILRDVRLVVFLEAAALGGRVQAAAVVRVGLAVEPELVVAVPDVADGDRADALVLLLHLEDDVDVLLAAAADAEEGDADLLVGAVHAVVTRGRQGQRGARRRRGFEEVPAVRAGSGHDTVLR